MKSLTTQLDWQKNDGLIPAIIQDDASNQVLMLGYMNQEALKMTKETGQVWFWSRFKERLWKKGESSGNTLNLRSIKADCDGDTLLVRAIPVGPICHRGDISCFGREKQGSAFDELFAIISTRKEEMPYDSYTASLLRKGQQKICEKIDEEAAEVIQAAEKEGNQRLVEESVDLVYHLLVLLVFSRVSIAEFFKEVRKRMS